MRDGIGGDGEWSKRREKMREVGRKSAVNAWLRLSYFSSEFKGVAEPGRERERERVKPKGLGGSSSV